MTGLDGLRYITSTSDSAGSASIIAHVQSRHRPRHRAGAGAEQAEARGSQLPQDVQQQGVTVTKSVRNFMMVIGLYSEDGSMNRTDIADYVAANVQDLISRVPGVGERTLFGSQYAMRIWLDPKKLSNYPLTPVDVAAAIGAQNAQISAGQIGAAARRAGQQLNATISAQCRLQTPRSSSPSSCAPGLRCDGAAARRRACRVGQRELRHLVLLQRQAGVGSRRASRHRSQRARHRRAVKAKAAELEPHPDRPEGCRRLRHDAVHPALHRGGREDPLRGVRAGRARDVRVPAELAGDADPGDRRSRRAAWHLRRACRPSVSRSTR